MNSRQTSTTGEQAADRRHGFQVIPAIDIRGGRCVRLFQGDYARETAYSDDPVAVARRWDAEGAPLIHVVDLDGARAGAPVNAAVMGAICGAVRVPVEVSGGLRTFADVAAAIGYGAARIQLGSAAISNPALVQATVRRFPEQIVVSIDARDGEVMTDGWTARSGRRALDLATDMVAAGVQRIMYTDIGSDGAMAGPNVAAMRALAEALPVPVVASGGVSQVSDLVALAEAGCEGAIVGRALYEAAFTLREALEAVR